MTDTPDFHEYLRKQLIQYIKEEQKKGFSLDEIETVLVDVGHHKNLIQECFDDIKNEHKGKEVKEPNDELEKDFVSDLKNSIENFFGQITGNKDIKSAKKEETPSEEIDIIEEAVEEVKAEERTFIFEGIVFFLYLVALVILVLYTSVSTGDDFVVVAIGLSASFVNTFISFAAMGFATNVPIYIFIPVIVASVFYAIGMFAGLPIFAHMDMESLGIVNAVISMFFNILIINVAFLKPKDTKVEEALEKKHDEIDHLKEEAVKEEHHPQPYPNAVHGAQHTYKTTDHRHPATHVPKKHKHIEELRKI